LEVTNEHITAFLYVKAKYSDPKNAL